MPKDKPIDSRLQKYLDLSVSASNRSKATLLTVGVAAVLTVAACWKALPNHWFHIRYRAAIDAYNYWEYAETHVDRGLERLKQSQLTDAEQDRITRGKRITDAIPLVSKEHAFSYLQEAQRQRQEHVRTIRLPLFLVTFDINDLGFLTGISFSLLLFILTLVLRRETECVAESFEYAASVNARHLRHAYITLAMAQMVHIPRSLIERREDHGWRFASRLLIGLPVLVEFLVLVLDLLTIPLGALLDMNMTVITIFVGLLGLILSFWLTRCCVAEVVEIEKHWAQARERIVAADHAGDN